MTNSISIAKRTISIDAALKAVQAGLDRGRERGAAIVIAVTDIGGELMALGRADGAFGASVEIARDKAYSAATFGCSTDQLSAAIGDNHVLRDGLGARKGVVLFGGGFPIIENGEIIGGVGGSGGTEDDDRSCAQAALAALGLEAES